MVPSEINIWIDVFKDYHTCVGKLVHLIKIRFYAAKDGNFSLIKLFRNGQSTFICSYCIWIVLCRSKHPFVVMIMYIITTTCASNAFLFAEISEDEFTKYTNLLRRASNKYLIRYVVCRCWHSNTNLHFRNNYLTNVNTFKSPLLDTNVTTE